MVKHRHVSPHYPHLGASPDGLISCSCCNDGLIKCPYSFRYEDPTQVKEDKFYLKETTKGLKLLESHEYYFQI